MVEHPAVERTLEVVARERDAMLALLQELVRIPSVGGSEGRC